MSKRQSRRANRKLQSAAQLLVLGISMVVVPLFLKDSAIGAGLKQLPFIGVLFILVGGLLFWLGRQSADGHAPKVSSGRPTSNKNLHKTPQKTHPSLVLPAHPQPEDPSADPEPMRPTAWGPSVLAVIEWRRLEAVVEALFQQAGFETKAQSHGADGGVDIWLYSKNKPGEPASLVQCKHWTAKVGVDKVREFKGVMASHKAERGQFVGTSGFTPDAETFAKANGINLLDRTKLLGLISLRQPEQQQALLAVALEGEYWKPTCASCGIKMVRRVAQRSSQTFWGCVRFPACRNTL